MNSTRTIDYQYGGDNYTKKSFRLKKYQNVKCKTINFLQDSVREYLCGLGYGEKFVLG